MLSPSFSFPSTNQPSKYSLRNIDSVFVLLLREQHESQIKVPDSVQKKKKKGTRHQDNINVTAGNLQGHH